MISATIGVAHHASCIESAREKLAIKIHRASYNRPPITLLPRALAAGSAE
jgi:hypothetical protein